jgi:hypothetical protein
MAPTEDRPVTLRIVSAERLEKYAHVDSSRVVLEFDPQHYDGDYGPGWFFHFLPPAADVAEVIYLGGRVDAPPIAEAERILGRPILA